MADDNHQELIDLLDDDDFDPEDSLMEYFSEEIFQEELTGDIVLCS